MIGHKRSGVFSIHYTDYLLSMQTVREALEALAKAYFPTYEPVYVLSKCLVDIPNMITATNSLSNELNA